MKNQALAIKFIEYFCEGNIDDLATLLDENLNFEGPLFSFNSASAYLSGLRIDPPLKCKFRVQSVTESADAVAVFYRYLKPGRDMQMAQLFKVNNSKIYEILLVFDTIG